MQILISAHFQTCSECEQVIASGSQGETGDVRDVIYYYLSLRLQDAVSAECSWHRHILGKQFAFHLELRSCSCCRKELRIRQTHRVPRKTHTLTHTRRHMETHI